MYDSGGGGNALTKQLLILGVSMGVSLIFLLAAGIRYQDWLPMLNLIYVVLTPMAVVLSEALGMRSSYDGYNELKAAWANFGGCFFGVILISLFGLPLVLLHNGSVGKEAFGLWIASTIVTFAASVYYWIARARAKAASY